MRLWCAGFIRSFKYNQKLDHRRAADVGKFPAAPHKDDGWQPFGLRTSRRYETGLQYFACGVPNNARTFLLPAHHRNWVTPAFVPEGYSTETLTN